MLLICLAWLQNLNAYRDLLTNHEILEPLRLAGFYSLSLTIISMLLELNVIQAT